MVKFAHLADCHIGSWRDPKLKDITTIAFCKAIDVCIKEDVDFVLICGDLFNTSLPTVDHLKTVIRQLKLLKEKGIRVYGIAGSHDFSSSGKTMLDVLSEAGLFINVAKGTMLDEQLKLNITVDEKTGVKLTGIIGKKGGLEKEYYKLLDKASLEAEEGFKIFLFHTALNELKPKHLEMMEANPISLFPSGWTYYAGGHVHIVENLKLDNYPEVVYPGPIYPNNFGELEKLEGGGFYIVEGDSQEVRKKYIKLDMQEIMNFIFNCEGKSAAEVEQDVEKTLKGKDFENTIVTLRFEGCLKTGKQSDINFSRMFDMAYEQSAYFVMKNTVKLSAQEFEEVHVASHQSLEDVEAQLIKENSGQLTVFPIDKEMVLTKTLLHGFGLEKDEGERIADFEKKVLDEIEKIFSQ